MDLPDVYDHANFRAYLDAWFRAKKEQNPRFSHRGFAKRVGSSDPSVLLNVISGRRRLPPERIDDFARAIGLEGDVAEYFRQLVRFGQAEDPAERDRAWAAIAELRSRRRAPEIGGDRFLYLSNRLYPAVRALAECAGFVADPRWVAERLDPPPTVEEAAEALALLERMGFLVREGDRLTPADPVLRTSETVSALGSYGYHRQNHGLAAEVLERLWDPGADLADRTAFLGTTIAVPAARLTELRRLLWELQLQVMHQSDAWPEERDTVVQICIQAFPVTRTPAT